MPAGRPKEWTEKKIKSIIAALKKYIEETERPSIYEFAYKHDVRRGSLYDHPEFADILAKLKNKEAADLIEKGLGGKYNPTITKLCLSNLGITEKTEITHKGDSKAPLVFEIVQNEDQ